MNLIGALRSALARSSIPIMRPLQVRTIRDLAERAHAGTKSAADELISLAFESRAEGVVEAASAALRTLESGPAFDALCERWWRSRDNRIWTVIAVSAARPSDETPARIAVLLKRRDLSALRAYRPGSVRGVIAAYQDADSDIAGAAPHALALLSNEAAVEELVEILETGDSTAANIALAALTSVNAPSVLRRISAIWASSRDSRLEDLVRQRGAVPDEPIKAKIAVLALMNDVPSLSRLRVSGMPALSDLADDPDERLSGVARTALAALADRDARDFICRLATEGNETAKAAAIAGHYLPRQADFAAYYLFITGQQALYDDLDPDRSLLQMFLQSASEPARRDIAIRIRSGGRQDMLPVLLGNDYLRHPERWSPEDLRRIVDGLVAEEQWEHVWRLAFEVAPTESADIVDKIGASGWTPPHEDDRGALQELRQLLAEAGRRRVFDLGPGLPAAVHVQKIRTEGGVNAVAFSATEPHVALGLSQRRVVIWNYGEARRNRVSDELGHSIAHLAYTSQGRLLAAERTNTADGCGVFLMEARTGQWSSLHTGVGSITALEHIEGDRVLIADRGGNVTVLDVLTRITEASLTLEEWAREAKVSQARDTAALLHRGATLVALPSLSPIAQGARDAGVTRNAAFAGQSTVLALGRHNGDLRYVRVKGTRLVADRQPLHVHRTRVQGVEFIPGRNVIASGSLDGDVRLLAAEGGGTVGVLPRVAALRSLTVSPDGAFMALGHGDNHMSFWDLRVMDLPMLAAQPLALSRPKHLVAVRAATQPGTSPTFALRYLSAALRYRFRYAVQIDDVRTLRRGDYDITID